MPSEADRSLRSTILYLVATTAALGTLYYVSSSLKETLDNFLAQASGENPNTLLQHKKVLAERLKKPEIVTMELNSQELMISADVIGCDEISTSFSSIGGMENELEDLNNHIILPMQMWKLMKGKNSIACPTGVLLCKFLPYIISNELHYLNYTCLKSDGRPGTGKTMMAKAIAKESGATFIGIKASTLLNKWVGESEKLVTALFSLSKKLAPSVVFIDEMDTLLNNRSNGSGNTSVTSMQVLSLILFYSNDSFRSNRLLAYVVLICCT